MPAAMSTLKVNGLTYRTIERDVERMFDRFGKINEVFIPKDKYSGKSRGFAFVRFFDKDDARDAYDDQNGRVHDGRRITIEWSRKDDGYERRAAKRRSRSRSRSPRRRSRSRERRRSRSRSRRSRERRRSPELKSRENSQRDRGSSRERRRRSISRERPTSRTSERDRDRPARNRSRSGSEPRRRY